MSAVRSIRYEPAPDATWAVENGEGDDMDLDDSDEEEEEEEEEEEITDDEEVEGDGDEEEYDYREPSYSRSARPNGHARGQKEKKTRMPAAQALPIAELPDDYDGQVLDGATYLAISARVNATLPNYTRMSVPPVERQTARVVQPQASTSRHPALPNEAWMTVFPLHFKNYRARVQRNWPPDLPYPSYLPPRPRPNNRGDVWQYIRGHRRKLLDPDHGKDKGKGKAVEPEDEEEAMNGEAEQEEEEEVEEYDEEEEAMNTAPRPKVLEEETERHKPHEPLVSALQGYTSVDLVCIIELINTFISETLDLLSPFVMIPNDADTPNNPFPELYMRWLFACLLLLDDQLDGQSMSSLRDLARTMMKVAAWRWIRAVTDKEVSAEEGAEWKYGDTPTSAAHGEAGLEATLARCWVIFHAVVVGWAQRDLLDDLESMFK